MLSFSLAEDKRKTNLTLKKARYFEKGLGFVFVVDVRIGFLHVKRDEASA